MSHYFSKDWIYFEGFGFYISLSNPFKTINSIKGIFKPPKIHFWHGKSFPFIFGRPRGSILSVITHDIFWKDKYDTPRFEGYPLITISLFGYNLLWYWSYETENFWDSEKYWEQVLWYSHYKKNIFIAREEWPWKNEKEISTWDDSFLTAYVQKTIYEN